MSSPSNTNGEVLVLSDDGIFLASTTPANARRLLKSGEARVQSKDPFTIVLNKQVPTPNIQRRIEKMKVTNFYEYFKEPKAVYIQNISKPIGVLSLEFKRPNGEIIPCRIPDNRNPVILTNIVPYDAIRDSASFLAFLQPSITGPAKMQLLSPEEFEEFYARKQVEVEAESVEEVLTEAQIEAAAFNSNRKIVGEEETRFKSTTVVLEPEVNPRVISTCQQLDPENSNKIAAREALDRFNSLELAMIDYDYIISHCYDLVEKSNSVIRKWAVARMKTARESIDDGIIRSKEEKNSSESKSKRTRIE